MCVCVYIYICIYIMYIYTHVYLHMNAHIYIYILIFHHLLVFFQGPRLNLPSGCRDFAYRRSKGSNYPSAAAWLPRPWRWPRLRNFPRWWWLRVWPNGLHVKFKVQYRHIWPDLTCPHLYRHTHIHVCVYIYIYYMYIIIYTYIYILHYLPVKFIVEPPIYWWPGEVTTHRSLSQVAALSL